VSTFGTGVFGLGTFGSLTEPVPPPVVLFPTRVVVERDSYVAVIERRVPTQADSPSGVPPTDDETDPGDDPTGPGGEE
jgi:hypothetical protein